MKRNFIRILLVMVLSLSFLFGMISCGDNKKNNDTATQNSEQSQQAGENNVPETDTAGFSKNY